MIIKGRPNGFNGTKVTNKGKTKYSTIFTGIKLHSKFTIKRVITGRISARLGGAEILLRLHDEFQPEMKY